MSKTSPTPEQQARQDLIDYVNPHLVDGGERLVAEERTEHVRDFYTKYLKRSAYRVEETGLLLFNRVILGKIHQENESYGPATEDTLHFISLAADDGQAPHFLYGNSQRLPVLDLWADKDNEDSVLWKRQSEQLASGLFVARVISGLEELEQAGKLQSVAIDS